MGIGPDRWHRKRRADVPLTEGLCLCTECLQSPEAHQHPSPDRREHTGASSFTRKNERAEKTVALGSGGFTWTHTQANSVETQREPGLALVFDAEELLLFVAVITWGLHLL